jgi:hypothetical protein
LITDHSGALYPIRKTLRLFQAILYSSFHVHSTAPTQVPIRRWHLSQISKENVLPWFALSWQAPSHNLNHRHGHLELSLWSVKLLSQDLILEKTIIKNVWHSGLRWRPWVQVQVPQN